ncbi:helix-turn-helix transcriptional regulator [Mucilaginibacter mali]|uniref:Helix-turn-helix transcriptional regulator n=1 Tax=Mucilaginibacter mali TaxID=2740462 RepID=A0A7D4UPS8_9SPHI|nr:AraC family transcriptional regulator [Mucilaginibacter mali]QKJ31040.1 helix-turn-helix transcriptional regulator [Mucilaginibacter mali]
MKSKLLKITTDPEHSFSVRHTVIPFNANRWHYHSEVEIVYFKKGCGTQFIGDSISRFASGDLVIVGANLPHYWCFDQEYTGPANTADIVVVHFSELFWGEKFLQLAENKPVKTMLERAQRGLQINGRHKAAIVACVESMAIATGIRRLTLLLQALMHIANCEQVKTLSSLGFKYGLKETENDRINAIYEYSINHFRNQIQLKDIADVAHICPNSFCRYFKSRTGKTYSQFLLEIKVGNACKLLIENKISIKQLCTESGFNSFSSFHKYFKKITGKSPAIYKSEYIKHAVSDTKVKPMYPFDQQNNKTPAIYMHERSALLGNYPAYH